MKYEFELTLVVRGRPDDNTRWDSLSIDKAIGKNLTELLGQFLVILASVHKRIVKDIKAELRVDDDDEIPF